MREKKVSVYRVSQNLMWAKNCVYVGKKLCMRGQKTVYAWAKTVQSPRICYNKSIEKIHHEMTFSMPT